MFNLQTEFLDYEKSKMLLAVGDCMLFLRNFFGYPRMSSPEETAHISIENVVWEDQNTRQEYVVGFKILCKILKPLSEELKSKWEIYIAKTHYLKHPLLNGGFQMYFDKDVQVWLEIQFYKDENSISNVSQQS